MTVIAADKSEYQKPLTDAYGRRLLIARVTFGAHYLDPDFLHDADVAAGMYTRGEIDGVILYTVYLATATPAEQYAYVWRQIGPTVPPWLIGVELDVESWPGTDYAIHGDHSKPLNQLYGMHAHKLGAWSAVIGYGNRSDLAAIWPHRDSRCQVIVADYSSTLSYSRVRGGIGQQYTDGQSKWGPTPRVGGKNLPRTSTPFGACDHNVFPGFASAASLRAHLRPAKAPVPVKKPAPKPAPAPAPAPAPPGHYPVPAGNAKALVDSTRGWAYIPTSDGRIDVHHDSVHVHYLAPEKGA